MAFGAKGAIGAAMGAAGRSLASYGERTYREQLNERLEAARQKREDNIRTRTEKFQEAQATTAHTRAKELINLRKTPPTPKDPKLFQATSKGDLGVNFPVILDPDTKEFKRTDTNESVDLEKFNITKMPTKAITGSPTELGLTKTVTSDLQTQILAREKTLSQLGETIKAYEKNPQAAGIYGEITETLSGLAGQIPGPVGFRMAEFFDEGGEITDTRTMGKMLTGKLIPTITGDTSGRYSDKDIDWAKGTAKAIQKGASAPQVVTALTRIKTIMEHDNELDKLSLGWKDKDIETPKEMYQSLYVLESRAQRDALPSGAEFYRKLDDGSYKLYRKR